MPSLISPTNFNFHHFSSKPHFIVSKQFSKIGSIVALIENRTSSPKLHDVSMCEMTIATSSSKSKLVLGKKPTL